MSEQVDDDGKARLAIRRVVLTFGDGGHDVGELDALAAFAAALGSELVGVFMEESELLRAAGLPFTRTVRVPTGNIEPLETAAMAAHLNRLAATARREMERAANRLRVRHSFLTLSRSADFAGMIEKLDLVVREVGVTRRLSFRSRSSHRAEVEPPCGLLLIRHPTAPLAGPVAVVYDGTPGGARALAAAGELAAASRGGLVVVLAGGDAEACRRLEETARGQLAPEPVEPTWRPLPAAGVDGLQSVLKGDRGLAIIGAESPLLGGMPAERLVTEVLHRSLLLVR